MDTLSHCSGSPASNRPGNASRTALVHERLNVMAGSDKVLCHMHEMYPKAPIFTALTDTRLVDRHLPNADIHTSFLQKLPMIEKHHQKFLPLYMLAFEQFDLSDFDLVISSSHCAAKAVITKPQACHICYCHSPMRYAWDMYPEYSRFQGKFTRSFWALAANYVRMWDLATASRVDYFIANSRYVARRIQKFYGKPSVVIHPPVDIEKFHVSDQVDDYYLTVGRFAPYKRVDMVIRAFNNPGWPLVVIGDGEQASALKKIAGPNIQFKGHLSDREVVEYFAHCKASIHAAEEDFGINMAESLAAGRPVVAYNLGGACDIIDQKTNGVLFQDPTVESLIGAVQECESRSWDSELIRQSSLRFSSERFRQELSSFIEWAQNDFKEGTNEEPTGWRQNSSDPP